MSSTTSRWMSRSWLNASSSWLRLTVPSIEFSIGHEPEVDLAGLHRVEHVGHRAEQHELGRRQVGLGLQRLLGERAERPEEADAGARRGGGHGGPGYWACSAGLGVQDGGVAVVPARLRAAGRSESRRVLRGSNRELSPAQWSGGRAGARADRRRSRRHADRARRCAACRSPRSATRWSTTTARCARACPRRCTAGARPPSSASRSSASCWPTAPGRCCSPGCRRRRAQGRARRPSRRRGQGRRACCGAGRIRSARRRCSSSAPAPPTCRWSTSASSRSQAYGFDPDRLTDVGVAGLHRLLAHLDRITSADAVVVVAGMEGALASVIGGLTSAPGRGRAHQRRLRRRARRRHRAAGDARLVRQRRHRGRHRQRFRRGLRDRQDVPVTRRCAPPGSTASPAPPAT